MVALRVLADVVVVGEAELHDELDSLAGRRGLKRLKSRGGLVAYLPDLLDNEEPHLVAHEIGVVSQKRVL